MPEPSGRSFAELDLLFQQGVSAREFATTQVDVFDQDVDGDVMENYQKHAKAIFSSPIWRELQEGLLISKYTDDALRRALQGELGSRTLGDLTRQSVLIAAFDLDSEAKDEPRSWKPKFFHNLKNEDSDAKELAVEVALRTSAAPTYFPTADNFIDGGVAANNPAMAALALAVNPDPTHGVGKDVRQTRLLSLGTGRNCKFIAGDHDWGAVQWGKKLVDILIEGTSGVAEYECRAILGPRFLRLDPVLPDEVDLDDAARTGDLLRWADEARLDECIAWIQREMLAPPAA